MNSLKRISAATMVVAGSFLHTAVMAYTFPGLEPTSLGSRVLSELGDHELASMNGRFVASSSDVVYFGLEMVSTWISPAGISLSGGASLTLDRTATTIPSITFVPTATVVRLNSPSTHEANTATREADNSGIRNASGLVQSIQVAGDYNFADNSLNVATLAEKPPPPPTSSVRNSAVATDASGASAVARIESDRATVRLELPGQGVVEQAIRLGNAGEGQGALQAIQALGDHHRISNSMQLSVLFKDREKLDRLRQSIGVYLDSLRGL